MTVKRSGPFGMDASVDAPSATTGATAEEEDVAEDAGTTVALARSGVTSLVRTAGKISLARAPGEISLAETTLRATLVFLRCRGHPEGTTTTIWTKELGASKNRVLSPASWAELRAQHLSISSSSLLAR